MASEENATKYTIRYRQLYSSDWVTAYETTDTSVRKYTITGLSAGVTYEIEVVAMLSDGTTFTRSETAMTASKSLAPTGLDVYWYIGAAVLLSFMGVSLFMVQKSHASHL